MTTKFRPTRVGRFLALFAITVIIILSSTPWMVSVCPQVTTLFETSPLWGDLINWVADLVSRIWLIGQPLAYLLRLTLIAKVAVIGCFVTYCLLNLVEAGILTSIMYLRVGAYVIDLFILCSHDPFYGNSVWDIFNEITTPDPSKFDAPRLITILISLSLFEVGWALYSMFVASVNQRPYFSGGSAADHFSDAGAVSVSKGGKGKNAGALQSKTDFF